MGKHVVAVRYAHRLRALWAQRRDKRTADRLSVARAVVKLFAPIVEGSNVKFANKTPTSSL